MKLFVLKFSIFTPSQENPAELPKLAYVDSLFRRRLSQLTRMTIEVLHNLLGEEGEGCPYKLVFASFRGEIARQLKINKGLVEDSDVMPAPFSLSVFNTPPAAATIALKMKAGYTAIYPSQDDFSSALIGAAGGILCCSEKNVIFTYADEFIPEEYKDCKNYTNEAPLALACILSSEKSEGAIELSLEKEKLSEIAASPKDFISWLSKSASAL